MHHRRRRHRRRRVRAAQKNDWSETTKNEPKNVKSIWKTKNDPKNVKSIRNTTNVKNQKTQNYKSIRNMTFRFSTAIKLSISIEIRQPHQSFWTGELGGWYHSMQGWQEWCFDPGSPSLAPRQSSPSSTSRATGVMPSLLVMAESASLPFGLVGNRACTHHCLLLRQHSTNHHCIRKERSVIGILEIDCLPCHRHYYCFRLLKTTTIITITMLMTHLLQLSGG